MLASRYFGFAKAMLDSPKYPVRVLARLSSTDHRTVMGRTLSQIGRECGLAGWDMVKLSSVRIKEKMKYFAVPLNETWRTGFLSELLDNQLEIPGLNNDEIQEMVSYLCKS